MFYIQVIRDHIGEDNPVFLMGLTFSGSNSELDFDLTTSRSRACKIDSELVALSFTAVLKHLFTIHDKLHYTFKVVK